MKPRPRIRHRLGRAEHLRKTRDFRIASRRARKRSGRYLVVSQRKAETDCRRFGLVVSKRVGNAVVRNRVKRWLREIWRRQKHALPMCDFILRAKPAAGTASYRDIAEEFAYLFALEAACDV